VIEVLNRSFVSVYINNQDYDSKGGSAPPEERAELQRIHQEGYAKKLSVGTVTAFMLSPDGHTYDIVTPPMLATLERTVEHFKPTPGKPVVPPAPQIVPAVDVEPGQTWEFDRDVSARILTYFYPQTENNNASIDRIQQQLLRAKVLTVKAGVVTARVDGFLRMQHVFYPGRTDAQPLGAEIVGVLTFTADQPPSLQLVTTQAEHGRRPFTVAVRTVPRMAR
jgi:hypothetical protein